MELGLYNAIKDSVNRVLVKTGYSAESFSVQPFYLFFSLAYLMLAMHLPVSLYTGAIHDDELFWKGAEQILGGNWFGPYSQMTLAKGPGFPFFLVINSFIGIPITLSIAFFYLFSCWLLATNLRDLGLGKIFVLTIFVIALFHPALFPLRIIRDNIYPALSLIVISGAIRISCLKQYQNYHSLKMSLFGIVFGFFWLTREEGVWIIPGLFLLVALKIFQLRKDNLPLKNILISFGILILASFTFIAGVALVNFYKYGKLVTVDFKSAEFSRAIKNLNSVEVGPEIPFLPVSFAKRQEIYKISPTFLQ